MLSCKHYVSENKTLRSCKCSVPYVCVLYFVWLLAKKLFWRIEKGLCCLWLKRIADPLSWNAIASHFFYEEAIDKGLKKFVNKQEALLGVQGILSEWKARVLLFVQKRTCASFMVQTSSDSSLSVPLGDLDHLKILQHSFVIIYMDKCCNNFVFVCKKFYVSSVFSELNSPVGAYVVSNLA